jgi:hypothetical protein
LSAGNSNENTGSSEATALLVIGDVVFYVLNIGYFGTSFFFNFLSSFREILTDQVAKRLTVLSLSWSVLKFYYSAKLHAGFWRYPEASICITAFKLFHPIMTPMVLHMLLKPCYVYLMAEVLFKLCNSYLLILKKQEIG